MNYSALKYNTIENGTGIRTCLFVSGCNHACPGCHNQETWDKNAGEPFTQQTVTQIIDSLDKAWVQGITLSGGDPLMEENLQAILSLVEQIRANFGNSKDIWIYTGNVIDYQDDFLVNELHNKLVAKTLNQVDVCVDGPFILQKRDLTLNFRGSSNQRLIDIQKTQKNGIITLLK